jgi:hypothetical protein
MRNEKTSIEDFAFAGLGVYRFTVRQRTVGKPRALMQISGDKNTMFLGWFVGKLFIYK